MGHDTHHVRSTFDHDPIGGDAAVHPLICGGRKRAAALEVDDIDVLRRVRGGEKEGA